VEPAWAVYRRVRTVGRGAGANVERTASAMSETQTEQEPVEWFDWFNDRSGEDQIPFGD
jgi:hypothetical protein